MPKQKSAGRHVKTHRKFGGRRYTLVGVRTKKRIANGTAASFRKAGYAVRIVKGKSSAGKVVYRIYADYGRKQKKTRKRYMR